MDMLDGKVALITGCARVQGLGRAIALAFAEAGADLAVTDVRPEGTRNALEHGEAEAQVGWKGLESLVAELEGLGRRALALVGDVSVEADAERMVQRALDHFGRIDILVNNAAAPQGADRGYFWRVPTQAFDGVLAVNPRGNFLMAAAVTRHMLARSGGGRIINIASVAGKVGTPKRVAYSASKFAVVGLTQAMAQELAPYGITVNAICPGSTATARAIASHAREAANPEAQPSRSLQILGPAPVGRIGAPADVARVALFLADPAADFITGQSINVDGGVVMH